MSNALVGGCHCGCVRYELHWPRSPAVIPARRCSCSFCTRFNGTWTSDPDARLDIRLDQKQPLSTYRFGTQTAEFKFCSRCGVTVFVTCELDGGTRAVLNINTLDQDLEVEFDISDSCFDGELLDQRLERRKRNWIGEVIIRLQIPV